MDQGLPNGQTTDCEATGLCVCTPGVQYQVLPSGLFTLYTSDLRYISESCHLQQFLDDTATVGCVKDGQEGEYRHLMDHFVKWCTENLLHMNVAKTKEIVVDFRRKKAPPAPVCISGSNVETVNT